MATLSKDDINIGDRILVLTCDNSYAVNKICTVLEFNEHSIGAEFDEYINGHALLNNIAKTGYGWYVSFKEDLKLFSPTGIVVNLSDEENDWRNDYKNFKNKTETVKKS